MRSRAGFFNSLLRQNESPARDEATITFEGKGIISFSFDTNVETGTIKMIAGKYYKVFDPRRLPADGRESQTEQNRDPLKAN